MYKIPPGTGVNLRFTLLTQDNKVLRLHNRMVNVILHLPDSTTIICGNISIDKVTDTIYVKLLNELSLSGIYNIEIEVSFDDGSIYVTDLVAVIEVDPSSKKDFIELVLSYSLYVNANTSDYLYATPSTISVPAIPEGPYSVHIDSSGNWTAFFDDSLISLSQSAGGPGIVDITVTATQNTGLARQIPIVFSLTGTNITRTVTILQQENPDMDYITASPAVINVPALPAETYTIKVSASKSWAATFDNSKISLSADSGQAGTIDITVTVTANTDYSRNIPIIFKLADNSATAEVVIKQVGNSASISLSPDTINFPATVSAYQYFNIKASGGWRIINTPSDLEFTRTWGSGGTDVVGVTAKNNTGSDRTFEVIFRLNDNTAQAILKVFQSADNDYIFIEPSSMIVASVQDSFTAELDVSGNWTTQINDSYGFISILDGGSSGGPGKHTIRISHLNNLGNTESRTANIVFKLVDQPTRTATIEIEQLGSGIPFQGRPFTMTGGLPIDVQLNNIIVKGIPTGTTDRITLNSNVVTNEPGFYGVFVPIGMDEYNTFSNFEIELQADGYITKVVNWPAKDYQEALLEGYFPGEYGEVEMFLQSNKGNFN